MKDLLKELQVLQNEVLDIVSSVADEDYHQQFHPDLSPLGWHLGHCIYIESYWIKEQLFGKQIIDESLKSLYIPELSIKQKRGTSLPAKCEMLEWASTIQSENRALLNSVSSNNNSHQLLKNNYIYHFLIQHYSQHIETMTMVLTEMQIHYPDIKFTSSKKSNPNESKNDFVTIDGDTYQIGVDEHDFPYDNEHPSHSVELDSFNIAALPVNNSDYLKFMGDDGYSRRDFWSTAGWRWRNNNKITHPHHWRLQKDNAWYGINHKGPYLLKDIDPVYGLSYFEAEAFANWTGGRLPHEYEWEVANSKQRLQQTSVVWEWCKNTFHPYPGFSHYPYEGYSLPYFDDNHYVLKGGSAYTKTFIKRPSFRNYYTADKRHIFAGLRLVYD
jgi:ergothioneine biosynthesis protein EgtB